MDSPRQNNTFIQSTEAASRYGLTNDHIASLCRRGKVAGELVGGRIWYVDEGSLKAYLAQARLAKEAHKQKLSQQFKQEHQARSEAQPKAAATTPVAAPVISPVQMPASAPVPSAFFSAGLRSAFAVALAVGVTFGVSYQLHLRGIANALVASAAGSAPAQDLAFVQYLPGEAAKNSLALLDDTFGAAAQTFVNGVDALGDAQQSAYRMMGDSMADGALAIAGSARGIADTVQSTAKLLEQKSGPPRLSLARTGEPRTFVQEVSPVALALPDLSRFVSMLPRALPQPQQAPAAVAVAVAPPDFIGGAVGAAGAQLSFLQYFPDAMIDTALAGEDAIGNVYWSGVQAYVGSVQAAGATASAAVANSGQQLLAQAQVIPQIVSMVDEEAPQVANAAPNFMHAALAGLAGAVAAITGGATHAWQGLGQWYADSTAHIKERFAQVAPTTEAQPQADEQKSGLPLVSSERTGDPRTFVSQPAAQQAPAPFIALATPAPLAGYVTQASLATQLSQMADSLRSLIYANSSAGVAVAPQVAAGGNYAVPYAAAQNISNLSGVAISGATISGSSIDSASLPDLSGSYLATSGGTITGTLDISTTTATSTVEGNFKVAGTLEVGAHSAYLSETGLQSAGSSFTISTAGDDSSTLALQTLGRVGVSSTTPWGVLSVEHNGANASMPIFVVAQQGTTTAPSAFLTVDYLGHVGVGTSTPSDEFAVNGATYLADITAPSVTTNRLYSQSGALYWNGSALATGASTPFAWTPSTFGASASNATSTLLGFLGGLYSAASSTIGDGTQAGGLTINGGATTTGNLVVVSGSTILAGNSSGATVLKQNGGQAAGFGWTNNGPAFSRNGTIFASFVLGASVGGPNALNLGSSNVLGFDSGTGIAAVDANINRSAAGVLQIGTTAANALGQLNLANLLASASSTIGNGTQAGGLTISGGATTTGNAYFGGNVGIKNVSPSYPLDIGGASSIGAITFTGSGLNDATLGGTYTGNAAQTLLIQIDSAGTPDTFEWSIDNGATWIQTGVAITGAAQALNYTGVTVTFAATTGHTLGNSWKSTLTRASGIANTTGGYYIGNSVFANAFGTGNTAVGINAFGAGKNTGNYNTANGYASLYANTTGNYNTANGTNALYSNTTGYNNTANGYQALLSNTTGYNNTANGFNALYSNTTGSNNTANGYASLYSNTTGNYNTANGYLSLYYNTTGSYNIANGYASLYSNTTGSSNVANGYASLYSNTTGTGNTANGYASLYSNTTGNYNTANGYLSLYYNGSATSTVALGYQAARGTAAYSNQGGTTVGYQSGYNFQTGSDYNTLLGYQSGYGVTTGSKNILIGADVTSANANITTGSNNIIIGNDIQATSSSATGEINIGNLIFGTSVGTGATLSTGNVGIGTTSPAYPLDVNGNVSIGSGNAGGFIYGGENTITSLQLSKNSGTILTYNSGSLSLVPSLNYKVSGVSKFFIDSTSGNVGIGTTTPFALLSVGGGNTYPVSNGGFLFAVATSTGNATTTAFSIDSNGFLSIGAGQGTTTTTLSPGNTISMANSGIFTVDAQSGTTTISNLSVGNLNFDADAGVVGLADLPIVNAAQGVLQEMILSIAGSTTLAVYGESNGSGGVQNQRVGIATSSAPLTALDVGGDITDENIKTCDDATHQLGTDANGKIVCNTSLSDQRLKTDVTPLATSSPDLLSQIMQLVPVQFNWRDHTIPGAYSTQLQYGLIAQSVAPLFPNLVGSTTPTALTPDVTYTVNYQGFIPVLVQAVQDIWSTVKGFATQFTTKKLCVADDSGATTCITKAQLDALLANAGSSGASSSGSSSGSSSDATSTPDTTPPTITVTGANPATINVGSTYIDPGATVSDNVNQNLGYRVSLDGGATTTPDMLSIDTSAAAAHIITYQATDQAGNIGYAQREVDVVAASSTTP